MLQNENWIDDAILSWSSTRQKPFQHAVVDSFLNANVFRAIIEEFPAYNSETWYSYNSSLERKKTLNIWDRFGAQTYQLFTYLNSPSFINQLERLTECTLYPDMGLSGAGLHSYCRNDKLNVHLDYVVHSKLHLARRLNLIIYTVPHWCPEWGGAFELWATDSTANSQWPSYCHSKIDVRPNRAILFDTTQNSWHGLPDPIQCPEHIFRNSVAVYYLYDAVATEQRSKVRFAPYKDQQYNADVLKLIEDRSRGYRYQ